MPQKRFVVTGVVKGGVVIPERELPLPDGTLVDIVFPQGYGELPSEFWEELEMWEQASDEDFARWIAEVEGEGKCDEGKSGG